MPLYEFIPLPVHFIFLANVSLTPDMATNNMIAIGHSHSYQIVSSSDLQNCLMMGETYFSKGGMSSWQTYPRLVSDLCTLPVRAASREDANSPLESRKKIFSVWTAISLQTRLRMSIFTQTGQTGFGHWENFYSNRKAILSRAPFRDSGPRSPARLMLMNSYENWPSSTTWQPQDTGHSPPLELWLLVPWSSFSLEFAVGRNAASFILQSVKLVDYSCTYITKPN